MPSAFEFTVPSLTSMCAFGRGGPFSQRCEQAQPTLAATSGADTGGRPLDPLLVLAGLIAGVAVICLLLVGSRSANATAAASGDGDGGTEKN